jgi:uncharacterized protein
VVYLLDAYNQFGMVLQIYRILRLSGDVPPLVLVGISYDGGWDDYIRIRARDFTPSPLSPTEVADRYGRGLASYTPESGRASDFLELLATEIIPFVERRYPGQPADRTLLGYSYGGLFAAHVLLTRPELFNRYLMGSPAAWWHDDEVLALPDPEASSVRPGTRVFATVGSDETELMVGAWRRLVERLDGGSGVEVAAMEFPGEHHMSVQGAMYSRALRTLFRPADMVGSEGHAGVPDAARDSIDAGHRSARGEHLPEGRGRRGGWGAGGRHDRVRVGRCPDPRLRGCRRARTLLRQRGLHRVRVDR